MKQEFNPLMKFNLSLVVNDIVIIDDTTYPIIIDSNSYSYRLGEGRPYIAYAVLYKLSIGSSSNPYIYKTLIKEKIDVNIIANNNAEIYKFLAYIAYSKTTDESHIFLSNEGCFYNDEFYYNSSGASIDSNGVAFNSADWTKITNDSDYILYGMATNEHVISTKVALEKSCIYATRTDDDEMKYSFVPDNSFNGTNLSVIIDGTAYTSTPIIHTFSTEGVKSIQVSYDDIYGSTFTQTYSLLVIKELHATFGRSVSGNTVTFTDKSIGNATTWHWYFGDGATSSLQSPTHTYPTESTTKDYTVTLTVAKVVNGVTYTSIYVDHVFVYQSLVCQDIYKTEYYTTECHNFKIFEKNNTQAERKVYIYDYRGNEISTIDMISGKTELDISVDKDGVYIVEIWTLDQAGEKDEKVKEFPIYTFCDAEKCYENLFNKVTCCDSYCKENCVDDDVLKMRRALVRFTALFSLIRKYVYLERNKYLGMTVIDDTRRNYIHKVVQYTDILELVVNRCNSCFSDEDLNTNDCASCK